MMDNKGQKYYKGNISLESLEGWFDGVDLKNARIKLCGVLGDPMINPECADIVSYLVYEKRVRYIEMSTNGGTRPLSFWKELADISSASDGRFVVHFSLDGVRTNDYREGVNVKKVWENFTHYVESQGHAIWQFILFDYNKHEVQEAREIAEMMGVKFYVRKSWRNTADKSPFKLTGTDLDHWDTIEEKTRSGNYEKTDIKCRHKAENELFITSNGQLWPCCHLHDEQVSGKTDILTKVGLHNDLTTSSFYDILSSPWYKNLLEESWDRHHPLHLPRCYLSCGDNGKRQTQFL